MDPNTAYEMMLEEIGRGNLESARVYAMALRDWIRKGGFYPNTKTNRHPVNIMQLINDTIGGK